MASEEIVRGIRVIRRKRRFLLGLILIYLPAIWVSLEITGSDRDTAVVFAVWLCLVIVAVVIASHAVCPACGKYFHMHGFVPLWLSRCVHCGLRLKQKKEEEGP